MEQIAKHYYNEFLPSSNINYKLDKDSQIFRSKQFSEFDPNGNGYLSLAEVEKGIRDVFKCQELFDNKKVIMRAFQEAKNSEKKENIKSENDKNYIEKGEEFLFFHAHLALFYQFKLLFDFIQGVKQNEHKDDRVTKEQFLQNEKVIRSFMRAEEAQEINFQEEFEEIDKNKGGYILFDEFCDWAYDVDIQLIEDSVIDEIMYKKEENIKIDLSEELKQLENQNQQKNNEDKKPKLDIEKLQNILKDISEKLPTSNSDDHKKQRKDIFKQFDFNGNGFLSLAEVDKGILSVLQIDDIFKSKETIIRAFNVAKDVCKSKSSHGDDYIELKEFRYFLIYLEQFYEYYLMFAQMDTNNDDRLTESEFLQSQSFLEKFGVKKTTDQLQEEFKKIDKNGGGIILFDEFAQYAIKQSLQITSENDELEEQQFLEKNQKQLQEKDAEIEKQKIQKQNQKENSNKQQTQNNKNLEKQKQLLIEISKKLPTKKEQKQERKTIFRQIDNNGNGFVSLAEVDKGIRDVLGLNEVFESKETIMRRAFQVGKKSQKSKSKYGDDYLELKEFRLFLIYLEQFFEYYIMFSEIDIDGDERFGLDEFKKSKSLMEKFGVVLNDTQLEEEFKKMDQNGGGKVLFNEFCSWAIEKSLDLIEDNNDSDLEENLQLQPEDTDINIKKQNSKEENSKNQKNDKKIEDKQKKIEEMTKILKNISQKLPTSKDKKQERKKIFSQIDGNGNGYLSLAEVDKGVRDVLELNEIFDSKETLMRAFQAAKNVCPGNSKYGQDYIELKEFRYFLIYLEQFYEYYLMFASIDQDSDDRIKIDEFQKAQPTLEKFGIKITNQQDLEQEFKNIDKNGGGIILFNEFCEWAINKSLQITNENDEFDDELPEDKKLKPTDTQIESQNSQQKENQEFQNKENVQNQDQTINKQPNQKQQKLMSQSTLKQNNSQQFLKSSLSKEQIEQTGINKEFLEKIKQDLPISDTEVDIQKRKQMFKDFDPNGNGYLSLAEVQKGIRDVLKIQEIFQKKAVILRAFQASKSIEQEKSGKQDKIGEEYVEISEFKYLLIYLVQYFEYWLMFDSLDENNDKRVTLEEFIKIIPMMKTYGVEITDPEKEFKLIDANGGGYVLFDEFCQYAIEKSLKIIDQRDEKTKQKMQEQQQQLEQQKNQTKKTTQKDQKRLSTKAEFTQQEIDSILQLFPLLDNQEDTQKRMKIFKMMDKKNQGYISITEVQLVLDEYFQMKNLFSNKKTLQKAMDVSKKQKLGKSSVQADQIEKEEFKYFLTYIKLYFEYWNLFKIMDESNDNKIQLEEFKKCVPTLNQQGLNITNPETDFKKIYGGKSGVAFQDFCDWAIQKYFSVQKENNKKNQQRNSSASKSIYSKVQNQVTSEKQKTQNGNSQSIQKVSSQNKNQDLVSILNETILKLQDLQKITKNQQEKTATQSTIKVMENQINVLQQSHLKTLTKTQNSNNPFLGVKSSLFEIFQNYVNKQNVTIQSAEKISLKKQQFLIFCKEFKINKKLKLENLTKIFNSNQDKNEMSFDNFQQSITQLAQQIYPQEEESQQISIFYEFLGINQNHDYYVNMGKPKFEHPKKRPLTLKTGKENSKKDENSQANSNKQSQQSQQPQNLEFNQQQQQQQLNQNDQNFQVQQLQNGNNIQYSQQQQSGNMSPQQQQQYIQQQVLLQQLQQQNMLLQQQQQQPQQINHINNGLNENNQQFFQNQIKQQQIINQMQQPIINNQQNLQNNSQMIQQQQLQNGNTQHILQNKKQNQDYNNFSSPSIQKKNGSPPNLRPKKSVINTQNPKKNSYVQRRTDRSLDSLQQNKSSKLNHIISKSPQNNKKYSNINNNNNNNQYVGSSQSLQQLQAIFYPQGTNSSQSQLSPKNQQYMMRAYEIDQQQKLKEQQLLNNIVTQQNQKQQYYNK